MKLKLPKNSFAGIKIYCSKCKIDNPKCRHYENHSYRMRVHVAGTKNKIKSKTLDSKKYEEALIEAIEFKNEMIKNNFQSIKVDETGNDYSIADAILKYHQYLSGEHIYVHKRKIVTEAYRDECIRYCRYFASTLKKKYDLSLKRVASINQVDVADFYLWAENHYAPKTFNKCMRELKAFFEFLIEVEEIEMKNPFKKYVSKYVEKSNNETLTKDEFEKIIKSIDVKSPVKVYDGKGKNVKKKMYYPYLKNAFKLFLFTGCRREEVLDLRWSQIFSTINGIKFFRIENSKVIKSNRAKNKTIEVAPKYVPINLDLYDLLLEIGYEEKKNSDEYIIAPDRNVTSKTLMDRVSKSFTHYKEETEIEKNISLKNLRKTYLSWVNAVMLKDTRILSSHASSDVLDKYYLDPTILNAVEKGALEIKIFGT